MLSIDSTRDIDAKARDAGRRVSSTELTMLPTWLLADHMYALALYDEHAGSDNTDAVT